MNLIALNRLFTHPSIHLSINQGLSVLLKDTVTQHSASSEA